MITSSKNQPARRGWTLIEMTVMISLLSTFSYIGVSLINKLMELDTTLATAAYQQLTTDRFADQLRSDADNSTQVNKVDDGFHLTESTGAIIEYRVQDEVIHRQVQRGRRTAREEFNFDGCELSHEVSADQIEFTITKRDELAEKSMSSQLANRPDQPTRILVPIGRHQRFSVSSSGGDE